MTDRSLRERLKGVGLSGVEATLAVACVEAWLADNGLAIVPVKITPEMINAAMLTVLRENGGLEYAPSVMMRTIIQAAPPAADLLKGTKE